MDLSGLSNLRELYCYHNQLTEINLNGVTLTNIICDSNNLTSLQLGGDMINLVASDNSYTIMLSDNTFDLSGLPGEFDLSMASEWTNATVSGNKLIVADTTKNVTYSYDTGSGAVTFTLIPISSDMKGDVNLDGNVNVADAVLLQKYLLGSEKFTKEQFLQGDINDDGSTDVFDMVFMRKLLIKLLK